MKDKAIVGNIGHFDNEIDMAGLKKVPGIRRVNIKPQYDEWIFPDGHSVLVLAEGRLLNLGCATGHPSFVMSASFTNQVLAQLELHAKRREHTRRRSTMLPKHLDEEVARLHLDQLGVKLTTLTPKQAEYIGVAGRRARTSRTTTATSAPPSGGGARSCARSELRDDAVRVAAQRVDLLLQRLRVGLVGVAEADDHVGDALVLEAASRRRACRRRSRSRGSRRACARVPYSRRSSASRAS